VKKIGFFGGSFDPIHFGHINLALEVLEKNYVDEILITPAFVSPHKVKNPPEASGEDRLKMIEIAIRDIKKISIFKWELKRKKISYTIDTLRELKKDFSDIKLILDLETFEDFESWKDYKEILKIADLLIGCRSSNDILKKFQKIENKDFINIKFLDIKSTYIRDRIKKNLYCQHLTHKEILDYIFENNLYLAL